MREFNYIRAGSLSDAVNAIADAGVAGRVMAGGTDLLIELRRSEGRVCDTLVDISRVKELEGVRLENDTIHIGPLTTHTALIESSIVKEYLPVLSEAASWIGSRQIRNRGTVGGNIMNAAACADTVPPLIALDASAILTSVQHKREVALAGLFLKPYVTCAQRQEILTDIVIPKPDPNLSGAFIKLGRRNALSIARLSVATLVRVGGGGRIAEARIVPGAALPVWRRMTSAENMLIGQEPSPELFAEAGHNVAGEMIAATGRRWSTEYKEPVIAVLVRRALMRCSGMDGYAAV